jgi:predicted nicotinamide N-methyase
MPVVAAARLRAFVRQQTRLADVPGLPGIRLHTGTDVMTLCQRTGRLLGVVDPELPYWAFPWAGGLAIAHHLTQHPAEVAGRTVLDLGAGSGLCGIVAARAGAASVLAADVDPLAVAAIQLNARANAVRLAITGQDLVRRPPPRVDLILAGDLCYQAPMAARILAWLADAAATGARVLLGDPGRAYLPVGLQPLARYVVHTSLELEHAPRTSSFVYALAASPGRVIALAPLRP